MTGAVTAHTTGNKGREHVGTSWAKEVCRREPAELHKSRTRKGRNDTDRCTKKMPVLNSTARDGTRFFSSSATTPAGLSKPTSTLLTTL